MLHRLEYADRAAARPGATRYWPLFLLSAYCGLSLVALAMWGIGAEFLILHRSNPLIPLIASSVLVAVGGRCATMPEGQRQRNAMTAALGFLSWIPGLLVQLFLWAI